MKNVNDYLPKEVYLAGPINGQSDEKVTDWRQEAQALLAKYGIGVIDPTLWDFRGKEAANVKEIVERDKERIIQCKLVLANCWTPSYGTSQEILFAWERSIPVVVVSSEPHPSPWLVYHSREIFAGLEEATQYVVTLIR